MAAGKLMRYAWMHMSGRARHRCIKNDIKNSIIHLILHFLLIHLVVLRFYNTTSSSDN